MRIEKSNGRLPLFVSLIERSTDGGNTFSEAGRVGPSGRSFTDTGLAAQSQYVYRVSAVNADLQSAPTQIVATTLRPGVTCEAETASVLGGRILSKQKGFTGTGYVDPFIRSGDSITWQFDVAEDGSYGPRKSGRVRLIDRAKKIGTGPID